MITFSIERFSDQREGVWYKLTVLLAGSTQHEKTFDDLKDLEVYIMYCIYHNVL